MMFLSSTSWCCIVNVMMQHIHHSSRLCRSRAIHHQVALTLCHNRVIHHQLALTPCHNRAILHLLQVTTPWDHSCQASQPTYRRHHLIMQPVSSLWNYVTCASKSRCRNMILCKFLHMKFIPSTSWAGCSTELHRSPRNLNHALHALQLDTVC